MPGREALPIMRQVKRSGLPFAAVPRAWQSGRAGPASGPHRMAIVSLLLAAAWSAGCQTLDLPSMAAAPGVGRFAPEEDERRLWNRGREVQERLNRSGVLYEDPALTDYVNAVGRRLLPEGFAQTGLAIEVRIVKNASLNAFALPHGALYVHSGILARMENEAQLATLLGHEMAHVILRHPVRNLRSVQNKTGALATFATLAVPFGALGAAAQLIAMGGTLAAVSGYSQDLELEADREGLAMMARAGYDPREAPKLFLLLKEWIEEEKKPEPFFFSSHPHLAERIESYQYLLKEKYPGPALGGPPLAGNEEFQARTRGVLLDNAVLDLHAGRFARARRGLTRFLALNPDDPRGHYYLGETYRRQNDPKERAEGIAHYQAAIAADALFPDAYRGLGTLYYQEGKTAEAAQAFERYLERAPAAADRGHVQRLLEEMRK